jgi:hypothetical protein
MACQRPVTSLHTYAHAHTYLPPPPRAQVTSLLATASGLHEAARTAYKDQPNTAAALNLSLRQLLRVARHASVPAGVDTGSPELDSARASVVAAVKEVGRRGLPGCVQKFFPLWL